MKLTVTACDCGATELHVKFCRDRGGKSEGFFSLSEGKYYLETLRRGGHMTAAEFTETYTELAAVGLPVYPRYSDAELRLTAAQFAGMPKAMIARMIDETIESGGISPVDVDRLRELIN